MSATENTEAHAYFVVLIWTTVSVGAALAANNPSGCNEFAAEAAPTKPEASVEYFLYINPSSLLKIQFI
jgi:hypothetical protein